MGENLPVLKVHGDMCYATTGVVRGDAFLMVVCTGRHTFEGKTVSLVQNTKNTNWDQVKSRHSRAYNHALQIIGSTIVALIVASVVRNWIAAGYMISAHRILKLATSLVIVAVQFTPSSAVAAYRATGAARLAEDNSIVATSTATEYLAGINTLCVDKTGTLTENRLTLIDPYCISCDPEVLILTACLCSSPDKKNLDPVDRTLAKALKQYPKAKAELDRYKILDYHDFDIETKRTQALVESPLGEQMLCVKGAPRAILELYMQNRPDNVPMRDQFISSMGNFADRGFRSLAIARKRGSSPWELLGAVPMIDPLRFDTRSTLRMTQDLGVCIKIFTGDGVSITKKMIQNTGIGSEVLCADAIAEGGSIITPEIAARVEVADAYAEVDSFHKEKIVRALQSRGQSVAVTGDSVSDVPTLQTAYCGIAVEGASEAVISAADIVFIKQPGLLPIIRAVQTSRQIFQLVHNRVVRQTVVSLHVILAMLWYTVTYGVNLDLRLLILGTQFSDLSQLFLRSSSEDVPFSKRPIRWSLRTLFIKVLPLVITVTTGSCFSVLWMPNASDQHLFSETLEVPFSTRSQLLTLHLLLSDHWLSLLIHTDGRFWVYKQNLRALCGLLCVDLLATVLCITGWTDPKSRLSMLAASWVWIISLGSFFLTAVVRCTMFESQLLQVPLVPKRVERAAQPDKNIV